MGFARAERAALCDALLEAGPDAPTLCDGWTSHDLAAHLWVRENDPLAAPGAVLKQLAGVTESRMDAVKQRWTYPELVARIRRGPGLASLFAIPAVDEAANTGEFFIHTEDVRRPAGLPPRPTTPEFEAHLAKQLPLLAKGLFKDAPCGVVFERTDVAERVRVRPGASTVTVRGLPSELLLFAFGRTADADVRLIGDPAAVSALVTGHRGP